MGQILVVQTIQKKILLGYNHSVWKAKSHTLSTQRKNSYDPVCTLYRVRSKHVKGLPPTLKKNLRHYGFTRVYGAIEI